MFNLNESIIFEYESAYDFAYVLPVKKNYSPPKLYTAKGDLSKRWYVYFSYRNPKTGKLKRVTPLYGEANKYKTKEDRLYVLSAYRKTILELLKKGYNPFDENAELHQKETDPVGLTYTGTGDFEPSPTGSVTIPGGKIECSSCHQTHNATTNDGYLLRQANNDNLCTSCHTLGQTVGTPIGTHNGMTCSDCHQTHNTNKLNIYMIKNTIATPNSGNKTVKFYSLTGTNSFADGNTTYEGVCEVCHTTAASSNHSNNSPPDPTDSNHYSGQNCTTCHPHSSNFAPSGGGCTSCHEATPTYLSNVHIKHNETYGFACNTCHNGYGSGGASEPTHPSGTINIAFDPNGLATRNGQDGNSPLWGGTATKTCSSIYCHSDGRTAYRGTDGTYTWSGTTGSQSAIYDTPDWNDDTITTCIPCHSGTGNMTPDYTITTPGEVDPLPPATGSHRRGAHNSNSQENSGNGWTEVNCFWCHNTNNGDDGSPINQGTYGTTFHVDGQILFNPRSFVDGGTLLNNPTGGSFSYSFAGSSGHCGNGKTCW